MEEEEGSAGNVLDEGGKVRVTDASCAPDSADQPHSAHTSILPLTTLFHPNAQSPDAAAGPCNRHRPILPVATRQNGHVITQAARAEQCARSPISAAAPAKRLDAILPRSATFCHHSDYSGSHMCRMRPARWSRHGGSSKVNVR